MSLGALSLAERLARPEILALPPCDIAGAPLPGTTGTPASMAASLAEVLSLKVSRLATVGPTKAMPASSHALANAACSASARACSRGTRRTTDTSLLA